MKMRIKKYNEDISKATRDGAPEVILNDEEIERQLGIELQSEADIRLEEAAIVAKDDEANC